LAVMKAAVEAGKRVVRLHTGDPAIYGAITANKKIILTQGGPAILTLLSLIIPLF